MEVDIEKGRFSSTQSSVPLGFIDALHPKCNAEQSTQSITLPVKKVVLYKHGVGYFERRGE